jgi:hypothetical protein
LSPVSGYFAGSAALARGAVRCLDGRAQAREHRRISVQFFEQRSTVGDADVAPHFRTRRRNAREIAETARSEGKFQRGIGRVENLLN